MTTDTTLAGFMGIDWASELADARIDAYLIWADLTAYLGAVKSESILLGSWVDTPDESDARTDICGAPEGLAAVLKGSKRLYEFGLAMEPAESKAGHVPASRRCDTPTVAVIDDGIPWAHGFFRNPDRSNDSRIRFFWDQNLGAAKAPWSSKAVSYGRELTKTDIDALLAKSLSEDDCYREAGFTSADHDLTHGSHVASIAAGHSNADGHIDDAASRASIICVQLPRMAVEDTSGISLAPVTLDAIDYIFNRVASDQPLVINLSYGALAGAHDGSSFLERAMDDRILQRRAAGGPTDIVLPAGNGREAKCHAVLHLGNADHTGVFLWHLMPDDPTDTYLELWYPNAIEGLEITLVDPSGTIRAASIGRGSIGIDANAPASAACAVIHRIHSLGDPKQSMVLVAIRPTIASQGKSAAPHGVWHVEVGFSKNQSVPDVRIDGWIERDDNVLGDARVRTQATFVEGPATHRAVAKIMETGTSNSIAHGRYTVIASGLYANGSELGYSGLPPDMLRIPHRRAWPDFYAPCDEGDATRGILASGTRTGMFRRMNGTSVAAPQVTRALFNRMCAEAAWPKTSARPRAPTGAPQESLAEHERQVASPYWRRRVG